MEKFNQKDLRWLRDQPYDVTHRAADYIESAENKVDKLRKLIKEIEKKNEECDGEDELACYGLCSELNIALWVERILDGEP